MAVAGTELIVRTFEIMESGDCLLVTGGVLPGQNEEGVIRLDIAHIIPFGNVFSAGMGDRVEANKHPVRDNPLGFTDAHAEGVLKRGEGRFRFDAGDSWFRFARKIGMLDSIEIDMIALGANIQPDFYFVSKPEQ